ncbi:MAG: hypothetical protein QM680_13760 [Luteolibacter sp.]
MAHPSDDSLLPIRCPSCNQRFRVRPDFQGKIVQCGGCEKQFRVEETVIERSRKFYPGEKPGSSLASFQRVQQTAPVADSAPVFKHGGRHDPAWIEPMSPQRLLAGLAGAGLMAMVALILIFGTSVGGILDGMPTVKRLMIALFGVALGILLLVYANPKARLKSFLIAAVFGAGVISLPLIFDEGSINLDVKNETIMEGVQDKLHEQEVAANERKIRETIGMEPIEKEKKRLAGLDKDKHVIGLRLLGMNARNKLLIRDYLFRISGADSMNSGLYPRSDEDVLLVLSGSNLTLLELAPYLESIGQVDKIHTALDVIDLRVDNQKFVEGSQEKLTDRNNPAFYELNKRELDSIDLGRVERAVKRLGAAEPAIYRTDITRRMNQLLADPGTSFIADLSRALEKWSDSPADSGETAATVLGRLYREQKPIPTELVRLIAKSKVTRVISIVHELWRDDPVKWEAAYQEMGRAIEAKLLEDYPRLNIQAQLSATRMLGQIGTSASLPVLRAEQAKANREIQLMIDEAVQRIRSR